MRKIKFRAIQQGTDVMIFGLLHRVYKENYIDSIMTRSGDVEYVRTDTLSQYIGKKDKNGKEIYEGDIIMHALGTIAEVYWDNIVLAFRFRDPRTKRAIMLFVDELKDCEIIGNVFENKELNI